MAEPSLCPTTAPTYTSKLDRLSAEADLLLVEASVTDMRATMEVPGHLLAEMRAKLVGKLDRPNDV